VVDVLRLIEGFHQDGVGDWVAELACLHSQHVRHRPPFQDRAWVETEEGRRARVGTDLDCPLCDRAEMPEGLHVARRAGPFDEISIPAGLRRNHRVADHTWGRLRVLAGAVLFVMETEPPLHVELVAGAQQPIPPGVVHMVTIDGPMQLAVDFLVRGEDAGH
jgi:tellurite methyltransferase